MTPVQKIITTQKGLALGYDSVSRDAHGYSKELYMWGQVENEDIKDGEFERIHAERCCYVQGSVPPHSDRPIGMDVLH